MSIKRVALFVLAFVIPPLAAGAIAILLRLRGTGAALDAAPLGAIAMPDPRPPMTTLPLAVVVVGNRGTEITDALPIVELLVASGAFEVRTVAPTRAPSPLATNALKDAGLDLIPDLGFDDYARRVGRPPALVVVPYLPRWEDEDAAVIPWLEAHVGRATAVLSICQGAELAAAAGLFDGHAATANDRMLGALARRFPAVRWQEDVRWVGDDRRFSSALLAGGLDATLAAIDALAGRDAALRAATETQYSRGLRALADRSQPRAHLPVHTLVAAAYRWSQARVGVVIGDGVSEAAVAGLIDAYAATYTTDPIAVAASRRIVYTRSGLAVVPRAATAALDPGDLLAFAEGEGYGYDRALAAIARSHGAAAAIDAAALLDYPTGHLTLPAGPRLGDDVAGRPLLLGLLGVMTAWLGSRRRRTKSRAAKNPRSALSPAASLG
ncbi:MAG: hypothetical protein K8W52_33340 [Deltaproteobacteria bacterium]|nr:hypothetical protein [Deltaproteobacteria bacterium]